MCSTYRGQPNKELFLEHLKNGIEFGRNNLIAGSLVNLRKLYGSYIKLFEFLEFEAYPVVKKQGFHCIAIIISDDIIVKKVTYKLMEVFEQLNMEAKIFIDIEKDRAWLKQQVEH